MPMSREEALKARHWFLNAPTYIDSDDRATLLIEDDDERQDQLLAAAIGYNKRKRAERASAAESND
ncbi:hypothetical protein OAC41_04575 [Acidimicrobiales bacterium]|nr:hypothetical protein [bacterium]MDB9846018.1 hypothetical protein [Acidimicrobiales bacterium]MDC0349831.1 hypothetical protein [bacterium]